MRQIVLDTETTGIDPRQGHRIIEIGCVELIDRRHTRNHFHAYVNPQRVVEDEAIAVHGITNEFLSDKPLFSDIAQTFLDFVCGAQLVIHNAAFDIGFINHEFALLKPALPAIETVCGVLDTLAMAREKHPGQKASLDALCKRYGIDNSHRQLHGALLDAEILADVYLLLSGGQTMLELSDDQGREIDVGARQSVARGGLSLPVLRASPEETRVHERYLATLEKQAGRVVWTD
jgi:DNA polymerase-3 subunit epsilon